MKKLLSLLSAIAILSSSALTVPTVKAEGNPDLEKLAVSLGADTDAIMMLNFKNDPEVASIDQAYEHFFQNCSNAEMVTSMSEYNSVVNSGYCWGFAAIEMLVHNGIISPSDLQAGAETLSEIKNNEEFENYLASYHSLQLLFETEFVQRYQLKKLTQAEQIDRLLEIAERSMAENRYFMIGIHTDVFGHAVAGIGVADGNWSFNGIDYDKCILTLDSNGRDENGDPKPFTEKTCIYINSETKQCCVPYYEVKQTTTEEHMIIATYDDDSLINYKGMVAPSETAGAELDDAIAITMKYQNKNNFKVSVYQKDGTESKYESWSGELDSYATFPWIAEYYGKGDSFRVESDYRNKRAKASFIDFDSKKGWMRYGLLNSEFILEADGKDCSFEAVGGDLMEYDITEALNEGYYNYAPHYDWHFQGITTGKVQIKMLDNGMLISSDSLIQTMVGSQDMAYDEEGKRVSAYDNVNIFRFSAAAPVFITFDEENKPELLIDPDEDGNFNTPVEVGDVNCDGMIDAKDASMVLLGYSKLSGRGWDFTFADNSFLNDKRADFNGDGKLTAADASAILAHYADSSAQ